MVLQRKRAHFSCAYLANNLFNRSNRCHNRSATEFAVRKRSRMHDATLQGKMKWITPCVFWALFGSNLAMAQTTTLNLSQDLLSLGIAATNMVPNQPSIDAGPLLTQGVEYAKAHNIGLIVANPGSYYFLSLAYPYCQVALYGADNITIDFQGSELIFTYPLQQGIILGYSTRAVLQNFSVDYQPLPFTQVRVTSVNAAQAQIQYAVDGAWQDPTAFNSAHKTPGAEFTVEAVVFRNGQPAAGLGRMAAQSPFTQGIFALIPYDFPPTAANVARIRVGDTVVLTMRTAYGAITTDRCTECILRNIKIYASTNSAVDPHFSPSSTLERVYVMPKPGTDRLVSAIGGINFQASGPNNVIRLSRAIRTQDDGFGLYNWITGIVQSQIGNRQVVVHGILNSTLDWLVTVPNGSPVIFQRTLDGAILASAVVTSQSAIASTVTFTLDRDLPGSLVGSAMYPADLNQRGAGSIIERNTVQYQGLCCSGIDIAGWSGSTVRGNYIHRSAFAGITSIQFLELNPTNWQTTPLIDMTFTHNVIDGANRVSTSNLWWLELGGLSTTTLRKDQNGYYTLMPTAPHQNVAMTGNFVAYPGRSAFWAGNTTGGTVSGNFLLHPNDRPDLANTSAYPPLVTNSLLPIAIDQSTGVTSASNTIDNASLQMFVTDTQFRELAAYAPGSTIRLNAYNLGSLSNPIVSLTDADGNALSVTIQTTTAQALEVQVPSAAALGGAYLTLTSGNAKYVGTLFIDSQDNIPAVNGCTYESSPASTPLSSTASNTSVLVITQAGCSFQTISSDTFVSLPSTTMGTGVVSIGFAANTGLARNATIEIAGQPITLTQTSALVNESVTPSSGTGLSQIFAALYSDTNGLSDINAVMLSVSTSSSLSNGCVVEYVRGTNQLFIRNDAGTTWVGPGTPGSAGILQNGQCSLNLQTSLISSAGNSLTVNYGLSFAASFSGSKATFMGISNSSVTTGLQAKGTWIVGLKTTGGQLTSQ